MCFRKEKDSGEKDPYSSCGEPIERDYIQLRLLKQINYYKKASKRLQKEYYICSIANTVFMAAVPIILMLPDSITWAKYVSAIISAIAAVLSSVLLIKRTKDNWIEYRSTREALESELAAFKSKAAAYQSNNYKQRFVLFVERCERIMQAEREGWYSRMKLEPNQNQEYGVSGTSEGTGS